MFSRARSLKGVWGNLKFIVHYKTWAVIALSVFWFCLGTAFGLWLNG